MTKDELEAYVKALFPMEITLSEEELRLYAEQTSVRGIPASTGVPGDAEYLYTLYKSLN